MDHAEWDKNRWDCIEIRTVTSDDLDAVAAVEAVCFPAAEAAGKETLEKRIAAFPESFFVAEAQGNVIGFINGAVTDETTIRDEMFEDVSLHTPDGCYQSIFGLDVIPEYQHHKIASRLMRCLIEETKKRGKKGLILTCKERLIGFYETFGYRSMGVSASVHGNAVWYDMILEFDT